MRTVIGILILAFSVVLAYIRYYNLNKSLKINQFFCLLAEKNVKNNLREMLPFSVLFSELYQAHFDECVTLNGSDEVFEYIESNMQPFYNSSKIIAAFKAFASSSESELEACAKALIDETKAGYESAKDSFQRYGKVSFILYPSCSAMAMLIML